MKRAGLRYAAFWLALSSVALLISPAPAAAQVTWPVYGDKIEWGLESWSSKGSTYNFSNAAPVHGGTKSIAATFLLPWATLSLHSNVHIYTQGYDTLTFFVHGGDTGGQGVELRVDGFPSGLTAKVPLTLPAGTWTQVDVPVSTLGLDAIKNITWRDTTGVAQPTFYVDDVTLTGPGIPPDPNGPAVAIDVSADQRPISPDIYGFNWATEGTAQQLRVPVNRWGGNAHTRYNWANATTNRAADWYFENIPDPVPNDSMLPNGSSSDLFVDQNRRTSTQTLFQVPIIGWMAKAREEACGFSVAKYGPQQRTDPYRPDCGNGKRPDGTSITGNDPTDTCVATTGADTAAWVQHLVGLYGTAAAGGVRYYGLDNEPDLWNSTHRDVHPLKPTTQEMIDRAIEYAAAIKAADPSAKIVGPAYWSWSSFASMAGTYLDQLYAYEQANGVRLLDYLDVHAYSNAPGGGSASAVGDQRQEDLRQRAVRMLWDRSYVDESWENKVKAMIPNMRDWVNAHYPGTKLAFTEYNWGAPKHVNGAVVQADALGIFGREGLDLATRWGKLDPATDTDGFAFRMYRNYDGNGGEFGDLGVHAVSADQSRLSAYAAVRQSDKALTLMVINKKTNDLTTPVDLAGFYSNVQAQVYRYSAANMTAIVRQPDQATTPTGVGATFPPLSVTLFVIPNVLTTQLNIFSSWTTGQTNGKGGYCANLVVTNTSSAAVDWKVTLALPEPATIYNFWNAKWSQSRSQLTAEGVGWNNILQPGKSTFSVGFCANR